MQFTVIIATCDRPERLAETLCCLARCVPAGAGPHRVVVADNGARRPAEEAVRSAAADSRLAVRYARCEPRNRSRALNAGVAAAETEWLAFTDDDTLPDVNWLRAATAYAERSGARIFGGRIVAGEPDRPLPAWLKPGRSGRAASHGIFVRYAPLGTSGRLRPSDPVPFGANFFVRRDLFERHGPFDETLWELGGRAALGGEDTEFEVRVRDRGEPIGYCHEAVVVHPVHYERCVLRRQLRLAYDYGWREPLVFFRADRPRFEFYRVPLILRGAAGAVSDWLRGDPAGAVDHMLRATRCLGEAAGRLSRAYRQRAAARKASGCDILSR